MESRFKKAWFRKESRLKKDFGHSQNLSYPLHQLTWKWRRMSSSPRDGMKYAIMAKILNPRFMIPYNPTISLDCQGRWVAWTVVNLWTKLQKLTTVEMTNREKLLIRKKSSVPSLLNKASIAVSVRVFGAFYLNLLEFTIIYQFCSRMTTPVESEFWKRVELLLLSCHFTIISIWFVT